MSPPFSYQSAPNPFAVSIGELLARSGDPRARAVLQSGEAQAQADMARGQAIGGAVQAVGQIPQQMQANQSAELRRSIEQRQMVEQKRKLDDTEALDQAFASLPDRETVLSRVPGHLRSQVLKQFADADEAAQSAQKKKDEALIAERDYFGSLAAGVRAHLDGEDGGWQATMLGLQHAWSQGYKEQASDVLKRIQEDPRSLGPILDELVSRSPKQAELAETARHHRAIEVPEKETQARARVDVSTSPRWQAVAEWTAKNGPLPTGLGPDGMVLRNASFGGGSEPAKGGDLEAAHNAIAKRTAELTALARPADKATNYQEKTGVIQHPDYKNKGPIRYAWDPQTGNVVVEGKSLGPVLVKDPAPADDPMTIKTKFEITRALAADWRKATAEPREMGRQMTNMRSAMERYKTDPIGVEQVIVKGFNKLMEPDSVVMISEYAVTSSGMSLVDRLRALNQRASTGGTIPESVLRGLIETGQAIMNGMEHYADDVKSRIESQIKDTGITRESVFGKAQPSQPARVTPPPETTPRGRPGGLTPGLRGLENR